MAASILTEPDSVEHVSVMLDETMEALDPKDGAIYLDLTAGWGGHSRALLERAKSARLIAFDRDPVAVEAARERLAEFGERVHVVHGAFEDAGAWLADSEIDRVDGFIADLGISSPQIDSPARGMSFRASGPIDMRMDTTSGETALELIERLSQDELANVLYQLGEERRSRRVARCIKQSFERGELETTLDLRRAVVRAVGPHRIGGADPATRTFQALRIAVNRELEQLENLLASAPQLLKPGGTAVFISFHSLEDRLVKRAFQDRATWSPLFKKPRQASPLELEHNPRARSAKLRAARLVRDDDDEPESRE